MSRKKARVGLLIMRNEQQSENDPSVTHLFKEEVKEAAEAGDGEVDVVLLLLQPRPR